MKTLPACLTVLNGHDLARLARPAPEAYLVIAHGLRRNRNMPFAMIMGRDQAVPVIFGHKWVVPAHLLPLLKSCRDIAITELEEYP